MRILVISDVHIDHKDNWLWLNQLSSTQYQHDALILAGDVSDDINRLRLALSLLKEKFSELFFVPGNHDLWVKRDRMQTSTDKFLSILALCENLDVRVQPWKVGTDDCCPVWVVPLFSWYIMPHEGNGSLYLQKSGEDTTLSMWSDLYFTRWSLNSKHHATIADYFLQLNEPNLGKTPGTVISFSHFLPRQELIFASHNELLQMNRPLKDSNPAFNFSSVAGCSQLEQQIRRLGASIHIYGHQHRDRDRCIDDVRYVSHCLGYPYERNHSLTINHPVVPKVIFDTCILQNRNAN